MREKGGSFDIHCHPFVGDIQPSEGDIEALKFFELVNGQTESEIISVDGKWSRFNIYGIMNTVKEISTLSEQDKEALIKLFGGDYAE